MILQLVRIYLGKKYTIGKLYVDGQYFCDTLEDPVRDLNKNGKFDNGETKIYADTAIPYGKYEVKWTYSNRFKKYMPLLIDVPSFKWVRIHSGNTKEDTEGCILVGENKEKGKVLNSRITVNKLYPIIKNACLKGSVTIEIK